MLLAAVVSNLALYQEYLGAGARPAWAMAEDGLLPKSLYKTHGKYGTPYVSIIFLAAVNAVLLRWGFTTLIVIDVFLNMLYYILIFIAAVRLRQTEPGMERPFRVWGGTAFLALICAPAVLIAVVELFINGADYLIGGIVAALSGTIAYIVFKSMYGRSAPR
jgi:amino acid transporter